MSVRCLWDVCDDVCGMSVGMFMRMSVGYLWGCLWDVCGDVCGISVGFLWDACGDVCGMSVGMYVGCL